MAPIRTMPTVTCGDAVDCQQEGLQMRPLFNSRNVEGVSPTAGLNSPPLIRKNTQALTASEKPKDRLIYRSSAGFFCCTVVTTVVPMFVFEEMLATCVPAKAKNRKDIVPTNSPITATVWPRVVGGSFRRSVLTGPEAELGASVFMIVDEG